MIVASVVLAIGVSLLTISRKEFVLSSSANQSSAAFYAADSGLSCAEYWDANGNFATSSLPSLPSISCSSSFNPTVYECDSNQTSGNCTNHDPSKMPSISLPPANLGDIGNTYAFTFYVPFSNDGTSNQGCAAVAVEKYYAKNSNGDEEIGTTITSSGYNIGWSGTDCSISSPKKVNRTIQMTH
jgi:hypothetical protein